MSAAGAPWLGTPLAEAPSVEAPSAEAASGAEHPWGAVAVACVLGGLVLVVLSAGVANVALPALASAFEVEPAASVRVVSAYQLALVMAILPAAALGESLGPRRVFTAGAALYTLASALGALAPSLDALVAARFVQGLGGASVMALGVALLRHALPQARMTSAIGWNALAVALASAAAPPLGSLLLTKASWPWLFAIQVPIGVGVLAATRGLPAVAGTARPVDPLSVALSAGAFAAVVAGAERLALAPWLGAALIATSVLCAALLLRREAPKEAPMVPLDLLRARAFRVAAAASLACFAGQSAALVALPFHLEQGLGLETLSVGLWMTPWPLAVALTAPVAGRLADRVSSAKLCAVGATLLAAALAAMALWPTHGDRISLLPFVALAGVGFGLFQVPNNRSLLLSAPRARSAAAGGMQATARLAGQTAGAIAMTLLFMLAPLERAPRIGLAAGAALTLGAAFVSLLRADDTRAHDMERTAT